MSATAGIAVLPATRQHATDCVSGQAVWHPSTDNELQSELQNAMGELRDALDTEIAERARIRADNGQSYPVRPL